MKWNIGLKWVKSFELTFKSLISYQEVTTQLVIVKKYRSTKLDEIPWKPNIHVKKITLKTNQCYLCFYFSFILLFLYLVLLLWNKAKRNDVLSLLSLQDFVYDKSKHVYI